MACTEALNQIMAPFDNARPFACALCASGDLGHIGESYRDTGHRSAGKDTQNKERESTRSTVHYPSSGSSGVEEHRMLCIWTASGHTAPRRGGVAFLRRPTTTINSYQKKQPHTMLARKMVYVAMVQWIHEVASTTLAYRSRGLREVPREVFVATDLQELDLSYNQLTTLPVEIRSLSQLQRLYLYLNRLTTLPGEIGSLS
ncbi:UNVERIFIED_CONTAM: hypothetical protein PYX00_011438 [Menopon gallinae]|uniref:Uncharacterized protein n=1 Tax=Menopon gallinae TaxID=328185 RepID=A0AAW2H7K7_9NEOP